MRFGAFERIEPALADLIIIRRTVELSATFAPNLFKRSFLNKPITEIGN